MCGVPWCPEKELLPSPQKLGCINLLGHSSVNVGSLTCSSLLSADAYAHAAPCHVSSRGILSHGHSIRESHLPMKLLCKRHNICISLEICIASHDQGVVHVCMITHPFIQTRPVYLYAHNFWMLPCSGAWATKGGETYRRISP